MNEIGNFLKSARVKKGISLEKAAQHTKIARSTLEALEEGKTHRLPAKSYLRGFVISYGKFLGVNTSELMDKFKAEMGSTNPEAEPETIQKETWKTIPLINKLKFNSHIKVLVSLSILLACLYFGQNQWAKYKKERTLPTTGEPNLAEIAENTKDKVEPVVTPTNVETAVKPKNQNTKPDKFVVVPSKPETTPDSSNAETKNKIADSSPENLKENKVEPVVPVPEPKTEIKPQVKRTIKKRKTYGPNNPYPKELIVEAVRPTEIKIKIGNLLTKKLKLSKGEFHTIKARSKILFETAESDSVMLIYNGVLQRKKSNQSDKLSVTF